MRNTYIYTETKKLIKKYGTRDPFEIMNQMNIVVGETSRYKTLKGYCFMSCKTIYVMISSFLSEEEKMIVAAHELGHIILHRSQLKMAPMQQDLFYSIIVLQDAVKLSLITETMFILKTIICLSRNILLRVNISIPGTFMKGWNFLLILQRSQMKTHGCCGNLALTFIRL